MWASNQRNKDWKHGNLPAKSSVKQQTTRKRNNCECSFHLFSNCCEMCAWSLMHNFGDRSERKARDLHLKASDFSDAYTVLLTVHHCTSWKNLKEANWQRANRTSRQVDSENFRCFRLHNWNIYVHRSAVWSRAGGGRWIWEDEDHTYVPTHTYIIVSI